MLIMTVPVLLAFVFVAVRGPPVNKTLTGWIASTLLWGGASVSWLWIMLARTVSLRLSSESIIQTAILGLHSRHYAISDLTSITWKDRGRGIAHTVWLFSRRRAVYFVASGKSYAVLRNAISANST
jgi:hypothetical protein